MTELGRIVRVGFATDIPGLLFEKSFKHSDHPFYKAVYAGAVKINSDFADRMDTRIIKWAHWHGTSSSGSSASTGDPFSGICFSRLSVLDLFFLGSFFGLASSGLVFAPPFLRLFFFG